MTDLNEKQIGMMKHAWGFDSREPGFRNHYCTEKTDPTMAGLVSAGYFKAANAHSMHEGYDIFHLTEKAISELKQAFLDRNACEESK